MTVQNHNQEDDAQPQDGGDERPQVSPVKKAFVEPEISQPVNVLEATTFFQTVDSGGTG